MLITRETDYAVRTLRALAEGEHLTVPEISKRQMMPLQFAYKIIKKLDRAGIVDITRGANGGCRLKADLSEISLYDLMVAMDEDGMVTSCMDPGYPCAYREANQGCTVQCELFKVQEKLNNQLKTSKLKHLIFGSEN